MKIKKQWDTFLIGLEHLMTTQVTKWICDNKLYVTKFWKIDHLGAFET